MKVEVSPGEFLDRLTILEIKAERIADPEKLARVRDELAAMRQSWGESGIEAKDLKWMTTDLRHANRELWEIEDAIRACEARQDFGSEFVRLARAVYLTNDRRADLKRQINDHLGASGEAKAYTAYRV